MIAHIKPEDDPALKPELKALWAEIETLMHVCRQGSDPEKALACLKLELNLALAQAEAKGRAFL